MVRFGSDSERSQREREICEASIAQAIAGHNTMAAIWLSTRHDPERTNESAMGQEETYQAIARSTGKLPLNLTASTRLAVDDKMVVHTPFRSWKASTTSDGSGLLRLISSTRLDLAGRDTQCPTSARGRFRVCSCLILARRPFDARLDIPNQSDRPSSSA